MSYSVPDSMPDAMSNSSTDSFPDASPNAAADGDDCHAASCSTMSMSSTMPCGAG